eukprot:m.246464 g.246464  ORF g.246464 m.246464 type:complete len:484 (+) comp15378_c0_seq4:68-1519(+)
MEARAVPTLWLEGETHATSECETHLQESASKAAQRPSVDGTSPLSVDSVVTLALNAVHRATVAQQEKQLSSHCTHDDREEEERREGEEEGACKIVQGPAQPANGTLTSTCSASQRVVPLLPALERLVERQEIDTLCSMSLLQKTDAASIASSGRTSPDLAVRTIHVPSSCMGAICGAGKANLRKLEAAHNCTITIESSVLDSTCGIDGDDCRLLVTGSKQSVETVHEALTYHIQRCLQRDKRHAMKRRTLRTHELLAKLREEHTMDMSRDFKCHIFVDYANVMIGARASFLLGDKHSKVAHINFTDLLFVVEQGRQCETREFIGSAIPAEIQRDARSCGYTVRSFTRPKTESLIDDKIHAQVYQTLLDQTLPSSPPQQHSANDPGCTSPTRPRPTSPTRPRPEQHLLVLVTGDGNANGGKGSSSFPKCCMLALRAGWNVEVINWRQNISQFYRDLSQKHPHHVQIRELEPFADLLVRHKKSQS